MRLGVISRTKRATIRLTGVITLILGVVLTIGAAPGASTSVAAAGPSVGGATTASPSPRSTQTALSNFTNVTSISVGGEHTCAIVGAPGVVHCWGSNSFGQLGDGSTITRERPRAVVASPDVPGFTNTQVTAISAGASHTCAIEGGSVFCWGWNFFSQLGTGNTTNASSPTTVSASGAFTNTGVTAVSAGLEHTCVLQAGVAYCWGRNFGGQLGNNDSSGTTRPLAVAVASSADSAFSNTSVTTISAGVGHTCAIEGNSAFCWGDNNLGAVGDGSALASFIKRYRPVAVTTSVTPGFNNTAVTAISAGGGHSCAIEGASVYCWGQGSDGQLGTGNPNSISRPQQVATTADVPGFANAAVTELDTGPNHTCAIEGSTAFCWGTSNSGQVGHGLTTSTTTPVTVSASGGFSNTATTKVSAGLNPNSSTDGHTCALQGQDMFCWGRNFWSQLGAGLTDASSLTAVMVDLAPELNYSGSSPVTWVKDNPITPVVFTTTALSGTISFSVVGISGSPATLPTGITLTSGTTRATLSGTPTATLTQTCYKLKAVSGSVEVTSSCLDAEVVAPGVDLTGGSFRPGIVGTPLYPPLSFRSVGLTGPVTFTAVDFVVGTSLPAGLSIVTTGATTARIEGTPTAAGNAMFKIQATNGTTTVKSANSIIIEISAGQGGNTSGGSTPPPPPASTDTNPEPSRPTGPEEIVSPGPGAAPSLVDASDAPQVQQQPGQAGATSNGQPVPTEITTLDTPGADVPADERTPEQVAALQQAGEELVEEFNSSVPAGTDPLVTITNTDTGAVVNGLLVDPQDGETPVDVPVEDVVLVSTPESKVLFAAVTADGQPEEVEGGVLEVNDDSAISAVAYGLPGGAQGEVVIFSTPTLLGTFTTGADGAFAGQVGLPDDLSAGSHTLVLAAGGLTTSLGLLVDDEGNVTVVDPTPTTTVPAPPGGRLPATGGDSDLLPLAVFVMALGALIILSTRPRLHRSHLD